MFFLLIECLTKKNNIMKKIELPSELMSYICKENRYIFVDDFTGWDEKKVNPLGFKLGAGGDRESNGLIAENGAKYLPQGGSIRKGNHLKVSLRRIDRKECRTVQDREVLLGELPLFKDYEVVILTSNEALWCFAPVLSRKRELVQFLALIEEYFEELKEQGEYYNWRQPEDFKELALFLYKNNPVKETVKTVYDEI